MRAGRLEVAVLVLASGLAVLEPVEDIGIADLAILLQLGSDLSNLISWWVHHARVEDLLQYANLLRLRVPPWLWLRAALFTTWHCYTLTLIMYFKHKTTTDTVTNYMENKKIR